MNNASNNLFVVDQAFPIMVSKVEDHLIIKPQILKKIIEMGKHGCFEKFQSISNTDWYLPKDIARPYGSLVMQAFENHNKLISNYFGSSPMIINSGWFQQYETGDYHDWHVHPECMFTNVYYVEMSEKNSKTCLNIMGKEVDIEIEEGSIITFPSFVQHCSKPNISTSTKTVIGFNTNYYTVNKRGKFSEQCL